jgi:hypothetical protein
MKIKTTETGNFKFKMTRDEVRVLMSVVTNVTLGVSENSEVILDLISQLDSLDYSILEDLDPIKVITEINIGVPNHMIVV